MTVINTYPSARSWSFKSQFGILSALASFARLGRQWREFHSLRTLESLPDGLRKDIGWPANDTK